MKQVLKLSQYTYEKSKTETFVFQDEDAIAIS